MQLGSQKPQIKRHHHKSRNGCATCKQRRFKCDERKPTCLRCILAGKECVYRVPQAKIFSPTSSARLPNPQANALQQAGQLDPQEQRALLYFNERTIPDIETFWKSLIPRLSESEPAIRHITIAISTKHEALHSSPERSLEIATFAAKNYSLAIQSLTKNESADILLVSCVAFILLERLQDPFAFAGRYLDYVIAGLKILSERGQDSRNFSREGEAFNLVDDFLEPMFFQIELVMSMFCQPVRLVYPSTQPPSPVIPKIFEDVQTAREMLVRICIWRYLLSDNDQGWSSASTSYVKIESLMDQWRESFEAYLSSRREKNPAETRRCYFLKQQACIIVGAILFSVRKDVPERRSCRPEVVDLSSPSKIQIYVRIGDNRKVNLSGINGGSPNDLKESGAGLWPHAKRMRVDGGSDYILIELSSV